MVWFESVICVWPPSLDRRVFQVDVALAQLVAHPRRGVGDGRRDERQLAGGAQRGAAGGGRRGVEGRVVLARDDDAEGLERGLAADHAVAHLGANALGVALERGAGAATPGG